MHAGLSEGQRRSQNASMADQASLRIFLSYARADGSELAQELLAALELLGFVPILDRKDIAAAEDWQQRLDALIRESDTVVFLISPASVSSERCAWEVERAGALAKRIVPVVVSPVPESGIPKALSRLNFVDFSAGQSFARALGALSQALRIDLDWIREHTRLGDLAHRWQQRGRDAALLLRGAELAAAQEWLAEWHPGAPEVTVSQRACIGASAEAQDREQAREREQLEQMAQANASRAEALLLREDAVQKLRRRTLVVGGAAAVTSVAGMGLGALLYQEARSRQDAQDKLKTAEAQAVETVARKEAQRTDLEGQMLVYATAPGKPAMDDSDLTASLVKELGSPLVPLGTAVARTVRRVLDKTRGDQRPYVSTDLNGEIYFRLPSPAARRHALVVSMDRVGEAPMPGAVRDAQTWHGFLRSCGFRTVWLKNPDRDEVMAAVLTLHGQTQAAAVPASMARLTGVGRPANGASAPAPSEPERKGPTPNTLALFYFAGDGVRLGDADYLRTLASYAPGGGPDKDLAPESLIKVGTLADRLRASFAASCLILDTNFIIPRRKS